MTEQELLNEAKQLDHKINRSFKTQYWTVSIITLATALLAIAVALGRK